MEPTEIPSWNLVPAKSKTILRSTKPIQTESLSIITNNT